MDGDGSRGGAAFRFRSGDRGKPIQFGASVKNTHALEPFHPDPHRVADARALGEPRPSSNALSRNVDKGKKPKIPRTRASAAMAFRLEGLPSREQNCAKSSKAGLPSKGGPYRGMSPASVRSPPNARKGTRTKSTAKKKQTTAWKPSFSGFPWTPHERGRPRSHQRQTARKAQFRPAAAAQRWQDPGTTSSPIAQDEKAVKTNGQTQLSRGGMPGRKMPGE